MAYSILKDRAWAAGSEAVTHLDTELGFIYEEEDDSPVATIHELKRFTEYWNAK